MLNELQRYSATGKIDPGILVNVQEISINELIKKLKAKDFTGIRKWVAENLDSDINTIFRSLFDTANSFLAKQSVPQLILILAKYQYQSAFSVDHELCLTACLIEILIECEFE